MGWFTSFTIFNHSRVYHHPRGSGYHFRFKKKTCDKNPVFFVSGSSSWENPKKNWMPTNAFGKATGFVTLRVDALSVPCASHRPHRSDIGKDLTETNGKDPGKKPRGFVGSNDVGTSYC